MTPVVSDKDQQPDSELSIFTDLLLQVPMKYHHVSFLRIMAQYCGLTTTPTNEPLIKISWDVPFLMKSEGSANFATIPFSRNFSQHHMLQNFLGLVYPCDAAAFRGVHEPHFSPGGCPNHPCCAAQHALDVQGRCWSGLNLNIVYELSFLLLLLCIIHLKLYNRIYSIYSFRNLFT